MPVQIFYLIGGLAASLATAVELYPRRGRLSPGSGPSICSYISHMWFWGRSTEPPGWWRGCNFLKPSCRLLKTLEDAGTICWLLLSSSCDAGLDWETQVNIPPLFHVDSQGHVQIEGHPGGGSLFLRFFAFPSRTCERRVNPDPWPRRGQRSRCRGGWDGSLHGALATHWPQARSASWAASPLGQCQLVLVGTVSGLGLLLSGEGGGSSPPNPEQCKITPKKISQHNLGVKRQGNKLCPKRTYIFRFSKFKKKSITVPERSCFLCGFFVDLNLKKKIIIKVLSMSAETQGRCLGMQGGKPKHFISHADFYIREIWCLIR